MPNVATPGIVTETPPVGSSDSNRWRRPAKSTRTSFDTLDEKIEAPVNASAVSSILLTPPPLRATRPPQACWFSSVSRESDPRSANVWLEAGTQSIFRRYVLRSRSKGRTPFSTSKPACRMTEIASLEIVTTLASKTPSLSTAPKKKSRSRARGPPTLAPYWF